MGVSLSKGGRSGTDASLYSHRDYRSDLDGVQPIRDWSSFHSEFARVFGFPAFYGKNMNAWIDCMTSLDQPDDGMSTVHCAPGSVLTLQMINAGDFASRCPEQYEALVQCATFVNARRLELGEEPVLALDFKS
ncbi:barstar family protein [Terriglobus aquaticus]|uniref:barstar family protein n=1 Tax=Terriglobus aquaticus TaxID=940139 RepID=UPI0021E09003|nr:barstar family protein [Terriglobus aquaticus]